MLCSRLLCAKMSWMAKAHDACQLLCARMYPPMQTAVKRCSMRFYRFPKHTKLRKLWEKAITRWNWKATAYSRNFGHHFLTGK